MSFLLAKRNLHSYVRLLECGVPLQFGISWATKKNGRILSIESWLFNRDPYFMGYKIIPIYNWVGFSSPTVYTLNSQSLFIAHVVHQPGFFCDFLSSGIPDNIPCIRHLLARHQSGLGVRRRIVPTTATKKNEQPLLGCIWWMVFLKTLLYLLVESKT